jgi:hypothetical protein
MPPEPEASKSEVVTELKAGRQTFRYDAFISYSRKDETFAQKLEGSALGHPFPRTRCVLSPTGYHRRRRC